jgi:hypothetical protein
MAYIGKQPVVGNFVKLDAIVTSATATYNLLNGGTAYFPQTANNCIVSLNGVIQSPTSAYTISGSTIVFDSALTSSDSIDFILVLGDVLSIGTPSDGTVTSAKLASGTAGLIAWQSVQTTGFTASAGRGYPCNTTSSAFTVTLPASPSVGDTIILLDYAGTFDTNKITLGRNGNKIEGASSDKQLATERKAVQLVYIDATQGWLVSSAANETATAIEPLTYSVDFLVVAGGGGAGGNGVGNTASGGGGAGGYRNSFSTETSGGGGSSETSLTFSGGVVYTISVGAGGAGGGTTPNDASGTGTVGSNSSISGTGITTITSTGGGGGASSGGNSGGSATNGGSGGGCNANKTIGTGTANQGFNGRQGVSNGGGGGGGASEIPSVNTGDNGGNGGNGLASSITGSSVSRGGGGAGGKYAATAGTGGTGGGGSGSAFAGSAGTANTGGGGAGGNSYDTAFTGGAGGSGVIILRMPTASYSGTTTGSPTVTTSGADTILVYNASGSITG